MARGFSSAGASFSGNGQRWDSKYPFFDLRAPQNHNKWFCLRPVGIPGSHVLHWVSFKNSEGQERTFSLECCRWDPEKEAYDTTKPCCACDAMAAFPDNVSAGTEWFGNFIVRELQATRPADAMPGCINDLASHPEEMACQFRELSHTSWSPVKLFRLTPSMVYQMRSLAPLNQRVNPETNRPEAYDFADPYNGCDLFIQYNPKAAPAQKYTIQKGEPNALTEEEMRFKLWNVDALVEFNNEENRRSLQRLHFLPSASDTQAAAANSSQMSFDQPAAANVPPAAAGPSAAPAAYQPQNAVVTPMAGAPGVAPAAAPVSAAPGAFDPNAGQPGGFTPPWNGNGAPAGAAATQPTPASTATPAFAAPAPQPNGATPFLPPTQQ